jgi:hypothetical protein
MARIYDRFMQQDLPVIFLEVMIVGMLLIPILTVLSDWLP